MEGTLDVQPYRGTNPLYRHGRDPFGGRPAALCTRGRHAVLLAPATRGGWGSVAGCTGRTSFDNWRTTGTRRLYRVQIVRWAVPGHAAFDPRGANEAGFPWEEDYARIRPKYFDLADRRIFQLVEQGLMPCVVGAWGYHLPWLGEEKMKQHWRYLIARWERCRSSGARQAKARCRSTCPGQGGGKRAAAAGVDGRDSLPARDGPLPPLGDDPSVPHGAARRSPIRLCWISTCSRRATARRRRTPRGAGPGGMEHRAGDARDFRRGAVRALEIGRKLDEPTPQASGCIAGQRRGRPRTEPTESGK